METFKNIDWHPTLEDVIDDAFIRDERMQHESAMYKILTDTFKDPFEDIESEYAEIDIEQIKQLSDDIDISIDTKEEILKKNSVCIQEILKKDSICIQKMLKKDSICVQEEKSYIPGIRKLPFNFPRRSCLNKSQQAMCLRVLLRLSTKESVLTDVQRSEMEVYMALQKQINEEQKEFLDFAKSKWNSNLMYMIKCNKYVVEKWKAKVQRLKQLPKYYVECKNIPLSVQEININAATKKIKVEFLSYLKQGFSSEVTLPKLDQSCKLTMNPEILLRKYQPCVVFDKATEHFRLPVSEDEYCEKFALETKADLIISSSGLKCLLNNIDSNHTNTWVIPVVIKSHNEKNFVYIDKKLPPLIATGPEKHTWVYKYILRYYFIDTKNESLKNTEKDKCDKSTDYLNSDDSECCYSSINHLKDYEEDLYLSDIDQLEEKSEDEVHSEIHKNVTYKVFTIGPADFIDQHEQVTHPVKKYRMLVRTKIEGVEVSSDGKSLPLILAPKMEHQLGFGAEATTLEEGIHQWASLMFIPDASLARIRIEADTSEVIQIERHTITSLSNEIKRLYNVKVEDSLSILHNIIEVLLSLTPGRYILKHISQNGSFAYVYKEIEGSGKNVLDLGAIYRNTKFQTVPNTPWPLIDNMMTTPAIRCFNKMPAMFKAYPYSPKPLSKPRPRGRPKKQPTQESFSSDCSRNLTKQFIK